MNLPVRSLAIVLTIACAAVAANSAARKRLTLQRIAELTGPAEGQPAQQYTIEISGLTLPNPVPGQIAKKISGGDGPARIHLPAANPTGTVELMREFRYPTEFDPPKAANDGSTIIAPVTPKAFGLVNTGWTISLSARPSGKLVALSGKADYVEAELMNGGYGAVAGSIYGAKGELLTPNVVHQPKVKTTSTSFHIFALPGEPYDVTLYRGDKAEQHTIRLNVE
jgi:hypothetical protein